MQQPIKPTKQDPISSTLLEEEPDLIDLVARFVALLPTRIADLSDAANDQDWPALKQQLHALKGLSINFGYPGISQLAQQMEDALSRQQYGEAAALLARLDSLSQRVTVGDCDP